MSSLQDLKDELLLQKTAVESKFGTVTVQGTHPSPSEITAGINSINTPDLSGVTATATDVVSGKVFVNSSGQSVTGQLVVIDNTEVSQVFLYKPSTATTTSRITYAMPSSVVEVHQYAFHNNYNSILMYLSSGITKISNYAFCNTRDINIANFTDMQSLVSVGTNAFNKFSGTGVDLSNLPQTLTSIGDNGFREAIRTGSTIRIPANCALGEDTFCNLNARVNIASFTIDSNYTKTFLPVESLYFVGVNDNFTVPASVNTIRSYFNYRGSFKNLTFKSNLTALQNYCFGGYSTDVLTNYYLETVTFEGETPPACGSLVFAPAFVTNNFKIYVPDNALEAYKAVANLTYCQSCMYPVSQRP